MSNSTTTIELHLMMRKMHDGRMRFVWMRRWYGTDGKRYGETLGPANPPDTKPDDQPWSPEESKLLVWPKKPMSRREANRLAREKQSGMDEGNVERDKPDRMTFGEFRKFHQEIARGDLSAGTMYAYDHAFGWAEKIVGKDRLLSSVTSLHAARIQNAMVDAGLQPGSIQKVLSYMRAAFSRAIKFRKAGSNPFAGVEVKGGDRAKDAVIRSRDEIKKLKAEAPDVWWRAAIGLWFCGLRRDEALAMKWADVDFDAGSVLIRPSKSGHFKIAGERYPILHCTVKTENSCRTVPVPSDTVQVLRELQTQSDGSVYVFLNLPRLKAIQSRMDAGKWRDGISELVNNVLRDWKALQRRVLGEKVKLATIHDSRKSFCTHAADVIPIHTLAEITGDTVDVLTEFYTQVKDEQKTKLREAFDDGPALKLAG